VRTTFLQFLFGTFCKILRLFVDFDERHKNEEIAKLSLSLSLSEAGKQAAAAA
jgi:hypothetical protein